MPSELLHIGVAGLIAASLVDSLDVERAVFVVGAAAVPDLDTFLGLVFEGAHRSYLHNVFVPVVFAAAVYYDLNVREESFFGRWENGERVAWAGVVSVAVAGVALDAFYNGANLLFPVVDRFYAFDGFVYVSDTDGVVQTVFENIYVGTTGTQHYSTGVDPVAGSDAGAERAFLIASDGIQLLLSAVGIAVLSYRVWDD